jgi:hypothetical protein
MNTGEPNNMKMKIDARYKYSRTWFINSEIHKNLANVVMKTTENRILEIG